jgi:hypothetical protein
LFNVETIGSITREKEVSRVVEIVPPREKRGPEKGVPATAYEPVAGENAASLKIR